MSVHDITAKIAEIGRRVDSSGVDGSGGGGDDGGMNSRVAALEARIDAVATKADLAEAKGSLQSSIERGITETQRWMIATVIGLFVGFGGLFLAMSNALKPGSANVPSVIVVPATLSAAAAGQSTASGALAPTTGK